MRVSWYGNIDELFKISYLHGQSIYSVNIYLQTSTLGSPIQTHQYRGVLLSFKINSTSARLTLFCLNGHQAKHSELEIDQHTVNFYECQRYVMKWQGQLSDLLILLINGYCILSLWYWFIFFSVSKQRYGYLFYTHLPSNPKEMISSNSFTSMAIYYIYKIMLLVELWVSY